MSTTESVLNQLENPESGETSLEDKQMAMVSREFYEQMGAFGSLGKIVTNDCAFQNRGQFEQHIKRRDFPWLLRYGFKYGYSGETMYATDTLGFLWWVWADENQRIQWYRTNAVSERREKHSPLTVSDVVRLFTPNDSTAP